MGLKFHLDENVDLATARGLRRRGIDVTTSPEARLLSRPDTDQLEFARTQGRVLVTHDDDFLRMARRRVWHCGIAYSPSNMLSVGEMVKRLELLAENMPPESMNSHIEFLRRMR